MTQESANEFVEADLLLWPGSDWPALGIYDDVFRHLDGATIGSYFSAPTADDARGVVEGFLSPDGDTFTNGYNAADNIASH
jgi:hypothetical protein